jgi:hypothetical protein
VLKGGEREAGQLLVKKIWKTRVSSCKFDEGLEVYQSSKHSVCRADTLGMRCQVVAARMEGERRPGHFAVKLQNLTKDQMDMEVLVLAFVGLAIIGGDF